MQAKVARAAFGGQDPRPVAERWLMPDMLPVAAGQVCHPITLLVLMIADDGLLHV
jgi:hypothetical protein